MDELFTFLHKIENEYSRTIFNFHLISYKDKYKIYDIMKEKISVENIFNNIALTDEIKNHIKKLVYCDIHLTKHIINNIVYPKYDNLNQNNNLKFSQFFDINKDDDCISLRTAEIFDNDKSSLISYIKTTNKKKKVDYGEIKKTVNGNTKNYSNYFSGKKSDDYLVTTINTKESQPWIKTISKRMRIDIKKNAIITKGKSSILQTIEIVFVNRTCIKIFKDSTMHIILSKEKDEIGCVGIINKIFQVYKILFCLLYDISKNENFKNAFDNSVSILNLTKFDDKIAKIKTVKNEYGFENFKIGMFNLTYNKPILHTVFPSLLDYENKIKFFKGKKLNIVALRSLDECIQYVSLANKILKKMADRSDILNNLNIESESIEILKKILFN
ncbi:hypothetical protein GTPV_gp110 [Goatpox virus Pellor]|uniref:Intermediate transcription factor 3 large subunit n=1 Tax=Goatpox virus TaxID=186805 RepID=A0A1B2LPS1_9POXV|nr:hypothetical protein GTPV_gp110 [Goatpox virus Pellor]AOA33073.1 hypothetical protein GTPV_gp110 [Goatpox virus]QEJ79113.1 45kDa large subunit of intermediate transcription factor [Goatpox virus]